ncbi:MAG: carotene hydroxylase [Crocinitomicaceae bacterium]
MYWWGPIVLLLSFAFMEFVAWLAHKYLMHGFLWHFHKDHHDTHEGFFERNDIFFLIFAIPSALCIFIGMKNAFYVPVWIGFGIALYGAAYFFLHDIFIHRRFSFLKDIDHPYFIAIRKAHKIHHKNRYKEHGKHFGMLLVPFKYYKEARAVYYRKYK